MSTATTVESAQRFWNEEPSKLPGRRRIRAHIGGLHCSLCTGTIEKALGKRPGVDKVSVSLTHEQALIEYNPSVTRAEDLLQTLKDIGYTVSDPRKLEPFEEQERALERERGRFLTALTASMVGRISGQQRLVLAVRVFHCEPGSVLLRCLAQLGYACCLCRFGPSRCVWR
jgi:P-type Cu+ transporter